MVVWSFQSIDRRWVRTEAHFGLGRSILVPVRIDGAEPPFAFSLIQAADLSNWNGDPLAPMLRQVVEDVRIKVGNPRDIAQFEQLFGGELAKAIRASMELGETLRAQAGQLQKMAAASARQAEERLRESEERLRELEQQASQERRSIALLGLVAAVSLVAGWFFVKWIGVDLSFPVVAAMLAPPLVVGLFLSKRGVLSLCVAGLFLIGGLIGEWFLWQWLSGAGWLISWLLFGVLITTTVAAAGIFLFLLWEIVGD